MQFLNRLAGRMVTNAPSVPARPTSLYQDRTLLLQTETQNGSNRFAFKMLVRLAAKPTAQQSNLFFSPLSAEQAILLAANGAAGETQKQFLKALQLPDDIERINRESLITTQLLTQDCLASDRPCECTMANAIWTRQEPGKAFAERCAQFYGAGASRITDAQTINDWVKQATNGRIPQILAGLPPTSGVVLTNALYFKASLHKLFPIVDTREARFHTPGKPIGNLVPQMHRTEEDTSFYRGNGFDAVSLAYRGGTEMIILLPDKYTNNAQKLATHLNTEEWDRMQTEWESRCVHIALPRFQLTCDMNLQPDLKAMGIPITGDFSPMEQGSEPVMVTDILHKTFLRVNETGIEAAVATGYITEFTGDTPLPLRPPPYEFIVDRPFVCAIVHSGTGTILFMGVINDPRPLRS